MIKHTKVTDIAAFFSNFSGCDDRMQIENQFLKYSRMSMWENTKHVFLLTLTLLVSVF